MWLWRRRTRYEGSMCHNHMLIYTQTFSEKIDLLSLTSGQEKRSYVLFCYLENLVARIWAMTNLLFFLLDIPLLVMNFSVNLAYFLHGEYNILLITKWPSVLHSYYNTYNMSCKIFNVIVYLVMLWDECLLL